MAKQGAFNLEKMLKLAKSKTNRKLFTTKSSTPPGDQFVQATLKGKGK